MNESIRIEELRKIARELKPKIELIYSGTAENTEETVILKQVISFLQKLPSGLHLFCDDDFAEISIFSLVIFSFRVSETVKYVTDILDPILCKCQNCVLKFAKGKDKILQHFAVHRLVAYNHVQEFGDMVDRWRINTILPVFQKISANNDEIVISNEIEIAFYECLCNPRMLRLDPNLKGAFDAIFTYLLSIKFELLETKIEKSILLNPENFITGIIYCWYEGMPDQRKWSKDILIHFHKEKLKICTKNLTPDFIEEVYYYIITLQNPSNWNSQMITNFWLRLTPIFALLDKEVIENYFSLPRNLDSLKQSFNFPVESIFKLWYNHLASNYKDKPLDILLRALNIFLEVFKNEFWIKIEPYTFHSVLDTIFTKDNYVNSLKKVENNPDEESEEIFIEHGTLSDMVTWTIPFYHSVSDSKKIQMIKKVSMIFLRHIANRTSSNGLTNACFLNSSTALLRYALVVKEEERSMLYEKDDFETILYTKIDFRIFINNPLIQDVFIRTVTNPNELYRNLDSYVSTLSISAMQVLTKCIALDILLLCHYTYKLYLGKSVTDTSSPLMLLENFTLKLDFRSLQNGPLLAKQLLVSLRDINGLLVVPIKTPMVAAHNAKINQFLKLSAKLVEKFTDILPAQMSEVLSDQEAALGYWSCVFTSNNELYQAATNILYDTFDVEGRLEGIQEILKTNITNHIRAINMVLKNLIKCEFYEPCPRAIRVLMDIISACTDPLSGVFSNFNKLKQDDTVKEFTSFWELTWKFLDMIYLCTLKWASKYDYSELENFTKDTLDLSRSLIDSYREFSDIINTNSEAEKDQTSNNNDIIAISKSGETSMFDSVLKAIRNMLYWLRLSDEALLESCVRLIVTTSDLAHQENIKFNDTLVEMMVRYALKARKFSNKLTDQQSNEILSKAQMFNQSLVEKVKESVEEYLKEKQMLKEKASQQISLTNNDKATPSKALESRAEYLQRKAMSSSIMGRPKATQSKITSFGTFQQGVSPTLQGMKSTPPPLSKMELARRQLMSNRVVHPPSSAMFHTKSSNRTMKNENSSSDESEGDIESARELFAVAKAKDKGIQVVDINGKSVHRISAVDRAKLEEEYMRKRLNVDLNPFYETILQWDYTRTDEYPTDYTNGTYTDVKDSYRSVTEYQNVMRPLLLLECWQGLRAARDREEHKSFSIIVGNRTAVSDFYEVYASVRKSKLAESDISESDLIVLALLPDVLPGQNITSETFKRCSQTCLAKVKSLKNTKGENVDITLRIHRSHKFSKFLTLRSEIHAMKVMQMTTVEREYTSLEGLEFYDLVPEILKAEASENQANLSDEIEMVKENYKLNTSQAAAIVNTVVQEGFSLIQGPPGTGKTKTILGIIGYFLSKVSSLPSNVIKKPGEAYSVSPSTESLLKKQKVLICAPSNAAVDEIVLRLKGGVIDTEGNLFKPKLVRIGRSDAVNSAIKDVTLEELVDKRVAEKNYNISSNPDLERKFNSCVMKRRELRAKLDSENGSVTSTMSTEDISKLQLEIRELSKEINELGKERDEIREQNSITYRNRDLDRRNAQARILASSSIICSTLSGSAHDVLASLGVKFDTVIIDEACQCTELSAIIPLRYGGKRCIMVGDPNQLPPTVLSGAASKLNYNQSLFVRIEKNSTPYLLDVQYRMNPAISVFPSLEFYCGRLKDGPNMEAITKRPWHDVAPLSTYRFFDIVSGRQEQNIKTMSYVNMEEIRVAIELIDYLLKKFENKYDFSGKIGIISPYKEQVIKMRREFRNFFGSPISKYVDFNTIDGFQGQEKEIIIISCVRASDSGTSVGFLKDFRRMNVALTRAKSSMWILGHHKSLQNNKLWNHLISDAKERNMLEIACSGFLDPSNSRAMKIIEKYKNSHEYLKSTDDYNPQTEQPTKLSKNKRKYDEYKSVKSHKKSTSEKHQESEDNSRKSTSSGSSSTGTKKKSSIFGAPNLSENGKPDDVSSSKKSKLASSTKKKSSIFGGPSLAKEISKTMPYIKDTSNNTEVKNSLKNKDRHVRISEKIEIIPNINEQENLKIVDTNETNHENKIPDRLKSPPPSIEKAKDGGDEDEDDYKLPTSVTPTEVDKNRVSRYNSSSNTNNSRYNSAVDESNNNQKTRLPMGTSEVNKGNSSHIQRNIISPQPMPFRTNEIANSSHYNTNSVPSPNMSHQQNMPYNNPGNNMNTPHYMASNFNHDNNVPQGYHNQDRYGYQNSPNDQHYQKPYNEAQGYYYDNNGYNQRAPYPASRSGYIDPKGGNRRGGSSTPFIPRKRYRKH
ncbi:hypothetical protein Kpol_520p43 [Vanderwaltozyma polyspora DSM 70294]|uniref:UvrD-like helicase ATP-binding domain-containing protein n=1 Tax=Vanderwaltozyma polyspora (strain ATCC 22028 / DSM 70294 / BCRC 21397 / CBS 2163 / NBRC 10782 / NRRL Y-8283 / UCD 57-17) TaxID=436907 RepID=A7TMC6_VANPO|nr:uncharacterized protein Kpol_520p43 [Vanderwaltozyma polyspora DSM 70294]EDO16620.1 hypothetical protein Kpol_520p43 [Vanderwaltozyma polyspora DSM 70294]